ncbi:MAG: 16S rRNA (cytosine(1402)-N(4))-methyltransferase [Candidatus Kapabacteria bacterium]|nr:16S rRNA (cytosine(1402)-N(4))-methyltransferase [Candidatus Kapabacteria bacterium]
MMYHNAVSYVHMLLRQHLHAGDVVVDATAGNGFDARVMADLVGDEGTLYVFDIQQAALRATMQRLEGTGTRVNIMHAGHEQMSDLVSTEHHGGIRAITFNLGYLPGHDHAITTMVDTTLTAVSAGLAMLSSDGLMTIVCYRHPEGEREYAALMELVSALDQGLWVVSETRFVNQRGMPPVVVVIQRRPHREQSSA